jgi:hypothetical protein
MSSKLSKTELEALETLVRRFYESHWTFDELSDEADLVDSAIRRLLGYENVRQG